MKIVLCLLFAALAPACQASCHLRFHTGDQQAYQEGQVAQFVVDKIRPMLQQELSTFEIAIDQSCDDGSSASVAIQMDRQNYDLVPIQGHQLAENESSYQTSSLALSLAEFNNQISQAANFDLLPLGAKQNVVKELAFFLAESARFADVERVVTALSTTSCQQDWLQYAHLARRWSVLSQFATADHLAGNFVIGGSTNKLIAPVPHAAIDQYNIVVAKGKNSPLAKYVNSQDWQNPIELPSQSCQ